MVVGREWCKLVYNYLILLCGSIDIIRYHRGFDDSPELNWYLAVT